MAIKGVKLTEEHKRKIGLANSISLLGKQKSETSKLKLSKTLLKIGAGKWNKGKKRSVEFKKKISDYNKRVGKKPPIIKGGQCWNWRGGISSLNNQIRTCVKYKKWVSMVFQRDNWICQTCRNRSSIGNPVYLVSHHIKSFSQIMKENNIKTFNEAIDCEELWNVNNGKTLCEDCHKLLKNKGEIVG